MGVLEEIISNEYTLKGYGRYLRTEEHDSLVLDTQKQLFFWNSKGLYGGPLEWFTKVKRLPLEVAKRQLGHFDKYNTSSPVRIIKQGKKNLIVYPKLVDAFWENGLEHRSYWYDRLLSDETIDRFRLGFHNGWYMIPLFIDDKLMNFQARRDEPTKQVLPWYEGSTPVLFNSDVMKVTNTIVFTEGPTDALLLNQYGIPTVSHNGGAGTWVDEWTKFFNRQDRIYLVYDNDEAGYRGAKKIASILGKLRCKIYTFEGFPGRYDVVKFFRDKNSVQEFRRLLDEESKYVFQLI